ncbi:hypothetical protein B0H13DRAFT_1935511 [Mycena leptocephala]|nr:hypothetical protein B0H13DRAFT_1935511 [Mycena leptocephala]
MTMSDILGSDIQHLDSEISCSVTLKFTTPNIRNFDGDESEVKHSASNLTSSSSPKQFKRPSRRFSARIFGRIVLDFNFLVFADAADADHPSDSEKTRGNAIRRWFIRLRSRGRSIPSTPEFTELRDVYNSLAFRTEPSLMSPRVEDAEHGGLAREAAGTRLPWGKACVLGTKNILSALVVIRFIDPILVQPRTRAHSQPPETCARPWLFPPLHLHFLRFDSRAEPPAFLQHIIRPRVVFHLLFTPPTNLRHARASSIDPAPASGASAMLACLWAWRGSRVGRRGPADDVLPSVRTSLCATRWQHIPASHAHRLRHAAGQNPVSRRRMLLPSVYTRSARLPHTHTRLCPPQIRRMRRMRMVYQPPLARRADGVLRNALHRQDCMDTYPRCARGSRGAPARMTKCLRHGEQGVGGDGLERGDGDERPPRVPHAPQGLARERRARTGEGRLDLAQRHATADRNASVEEGRGARYHDELLLTERIPSHVLSAVLE